ncbi:hypothetical protein PBAT_01745 [Paenibacillus antarcticus]|uniref:Uncharacterized protein n=1 Tax=Paenibacillus antarcticus TaxID=253703 RepID=A0A162MGB4_9BACL|nr:hypothetical protein PBAT_01745 [Paenibacillus antarcticus]
MPDLQGKVALWLELLGEQVEALQQRAVFSHMITSYYGAPLMQKRRSGLIIEITDGVTTITAAIFITAWLKPP